MYNYRNLNKVNKFLLRQYATKNRPKIIPNEKMLNEIDQNMYKPRNHPGILKPRVIFLSKFIITAITNVTEDYPIKALIRDAKDLSTHLLGKNSPMEKNELKEITQKVVESVDAKMKNFVINSETDEIRYKQTFTHNVNSILRAKVYNWKSENYTEYNSLVYLIGRSAAEYAVLIKIFNEINIRDPQFKPKSLFDFGSGVGTVTWAAIEFWKRSIFEYFNVDSSREMNDLAKILLQGGRGNGEMTLKGVFYRQFLPASNVTYDLVVSAYSLLELPSRQSRLETVLNLWNKTGKYLVIVEQGTNAGFKIVNEIRDYILSEKNKITGHVFAPCPHDSICPRFVLNDSTPCNFEIGYFTLPIGANSVRKSERYSYVVLKKGLRGNSDPQWPRIVRETLVKSKHSICRTCTKNGELQEVIFTAAKHGKTLYHCARSSKWGDLLPITIENIAQNNEECDKSDNIEKTECINNENKDRFDT